MQAIQDIEQEEEVRKKFTELRQELGDKLKYDVDNLCEVFNELCKGKYVISGFIGSGGEGVVFEAIRYYSNSRSVVVAVKCVSVTNKETIQKEVEILKRLQEQPFIHQFLEGFYSTNKKFFFYVTEKLTCDLKAIMENLASRKQLLPLNSVITLAIQITTALNTLKANNIFHFDVKPVNVFYDKVNKCFKLADYGMAKQVSIPEDMEEFYSQSIFTAQFSGFDPKYISPEVRNQVGQYNNRTDVYSLGLILLELSRGALLKLIETKEIRDSDEGLLKYLSKNKQHQQLNQIIKQMLTINRNQRITPEDLLQKLESLQNEQESNLYMYLQTQVDDLTFQGMKQLYSSSLTQVNLDSIATDSSKRIFMRHRSLKFKHEIYTVEQLAEVEGALAKYQSDISTSLHIGLRLYSSCGGELDNLSSSVVSRLASSLKKSSLSITSLSLSFSPWLRIGTEGVASLSQSIGMMCKNLTALSLALSYEIDSSSLAIAIEKCSKNLVVVSLEFNQCQIDSQEIECIILSLEKCDKMAALGLFLWEYPRECNEKRGSAVVSLIAQSLLKCRSLTELTLDFDYCYISGGLQSLSSGLEKCEKLTRLAIRIHDNTYEDLFGEFYSNLVRCPHLITLKVQFNSQCRDYQPFAQSIVQDLKECKDLEEPKTDAISKSSEDDQQQIRLNTFAQFRPEKWYFGNAPD